MQILSTGSPQLDKAVEFCWETQRKIHDMRFEGWHASRVKLWSKSRKQLWLRFPHGIRTSAHTIFMEQLNEQLRKPAGERDSNKPVWVNEQFELCPTRTDSAGGANSGDSTGNLIVPSAR